MLNYHNLNIDQISNVINIKSSSLEQVKYFWSTLKAIPKGASILVALANSVDLLHHVLAMIQAGFVPILSPPILPELRLAHFKTAFSFHGILQNSHQIPSIHYYQQFCIGEQALYICEKEDVLFSADEIILTTSGTSGFSTGCLFDFKALWRNATKHAHAIQLSPKDTVLIVLPLYYSYAFVAQALAAISVGAKLLITSLPFNESFFIKTIKEQQVSVISITPLLARRFMLCGNAFPLSLRAVTIGGDSFSAEEIARFIRLNPHQECYITYGLTEAGPRVATLAAHLETSDKFASVGRVLPEVETHLEPNPEGSELFLRTDTCLKRRLGNVQKATFKYLPSGRWLQTGDYFEIDDEGYLFFKGRRSNFIVVRDEKINLGAVKKIILALPGIMSVNTKICMENNATIGYELSIVTTDQQQTTKNISDYLRRHLYRHEQPLHVYIHAMNAKEEPLFYK